MATPERDLPAGLYESVLTEGLAHSLSDVPELEAQVDAIDDADLTHVLTEHVRAVIRHALADAKGSEERLRLVNDVVDAIGAVHQRVEVPAKQLLSLMPTRGPGPVLAAASRPVTPLTESALLTNAHGEPNLCAELRAEIDTSDSVDLLCAFVKWHGLRLLEDQLTRLRERGCRFRVITTTYMGATERIALDRLHRDFGAEIKVQYDSARTRLHAKSWHFLRSTGFDTAYVGSSNLSRAALLDGVEWNVRLSRIATPTVLDKFHATFDTYWSDSSFEAYDPDVDADRLDDALAEARGGGSTGRLAITLSGLEIRPFPHQAEILEALDVERAVHDRHANLVVAATGTGKTVIAALDYRGLSESAGRRPSLLFVAHRREILEQSLRTYREVLSDASFGELFVGGVRPERWQHVFASVQSLGSYGVEKIPPDAYEIVVIDEFHHATAPTYERLIRHLRPTELLGLTATPERADGADVRQYFGGRTAAELRLWDALGADLLCPFHYFAVADGTDLRQVSWKRGRYDEGELSGIYTGNDRRAAIVLEQLRDKVIDPGGMRALGFCVSVAHAQFMAQRFTEGGVPALAVHGETPTADREAALRDLRDRRVNVVFAADLFNEGLDLPEVDTVLMLRPTESATIFLQQLGRGLRRTRSKAVLTVLDFVGYHRKEFRFDLKLRALTGQTRQGLVRDIEKGFPFLPSGCQIVMDRQAQALVLENIKGQVANRWQQIVAELRHHGDQDLAQFLDESGVELSDILRKGQQSWTKLRRDAGLDTRSGSDLEQQLMRRIRAFAHVDDRYRTDAYRQLLEDDARSYNDLSPAEQRMGRMLFFSLWPDGGGHDSVGAGLVALRRERAIRDEVSAVVDISFDSARHQARELTGDLLDVPLRVHARYQREEVLAALDYASMDRKPNSFREGVLSVPDLNVDAFFVTLKKSAADYSPTTLYRDYPLSPTLFHWESQSTASLNSPTGQRYVHGTSKVLLFVREEQQDEFGTSAYMFLGPVRYVSHEGERPIAITWRLEHAMPTDFFTSATVAAG